MATTGTQTTKKNNGGETQPDLEADIRQLREDISKLVEHLSKTGSHSLDTARNAAADSAGRLMAKGEAAIEGLRASAKDTEAQLVATVREKPVTALAIAAGVGFLFALMARR